MSRRKILLIVLLVAIAGVAFLFTSNAGPQNFYTTLPNCTAYVKPNLRVSKIQICELPLEPKRVALGLLIGDQRLAHSIMFGRKEDGVTWNVLQYRLPKTQEDLAALEYGRRGVLRLERRLDISSAALPALIKKLEPAEQKQIKGFFLYYSGAYEIFLEGPQQENALALAEKLNAILERERYGWLLYHLRAATNSLVRAVFLLTIWIFNTTP